MISSPLTSVQIRVPFAEIRPADVEPAIATLLEEARRDLRAIVELQGPRTYANTLQALDLLTERLDFAATLVGHLESVATTPELRAAHTAIQGPLAEFYAQIPLDEGLWRALQDYAATADAAALTGERQRLLVKTLDDFRRHGAQLGPAGKTRLAEISAELAQITTEYNQHVLDATNAFELVLTDPADLAGLPPSAVAAARAGAEARGLADAWRFTLHQPSFVPFLTHADSARLREHMYRAANICAEGPHDNRERARQILALRREQAELLGFADFADFVLGPRMAGNGAAARAFVADLAARSEGAFAAEARDLLAFRRRIEGPDAPELAAWDLAYYAEKQRQALYDFDDEALRPYFPAPAVLSGLFALVRDLYGVTVAPAAELPTWHPDVTVYEVRDEDGAPLGYFHADLYPRDDKRAGAWMNGLVVGRPDADGRRGPHLGVICANLTPPHEGRPALLTHDEVETIFHEFGHLLHHLLTTVEPRALAGTNVAWDFVELPSQIMENWCWERAALDRFARHVDTGAAIPDELAQRLLRARTFRGASAMMRQLSFATVDLELHCGPLPEDGPALVARARALMAPFSAAPLPDDYAMICRFQHLFGGPVAYAAAYYSYKWAEVLDADAFTRFQREGLFSRAVGGAFRRTILARGDGADPAQLFRDFMGRDPDPDALLRRAGLAA